MTQTIIYTNGIHVPATLDTLITTLGRRYRDLTGCGLVCTSGLRTPRSQAEAMYNNYKAGRVILYNRMDLEREIRTVWITGYARPNFPRNLTIDLMEKEIEVQILRGDFISSHLKGTAADFSKDGIHLDQFARATNAMGAFHMVEPHCIHVTFLT